LIGTAQAVRAVYAELVEPFIGDGLLGVREHGLVMRAFEVIQELDAAVQVLETEVAR
jgi:hypothetical protein